MYRILLTVIILISFAKTSYSQKPPVKQEPQKEYTISMPLQGWQTCFKALSKLPAEESREIMNFIEAQVSSQNTNVKEKPKTDSLPPNKKQKP